MQNIPFLGVGLGLRHSFKNELIIEPQGVDFIEIIAENYMSKDHQKAEELQILKEHFTIIPHAVGLSLGSAKGINEKYLDQLAPLISQINPPYWSEHICFTETHGLQIGHLSPLEFTQESVEVLVRNIEKVKEKIKIPLILENITYIFTTRKDMSEAEFVAKIIRETNCGLLLDITNIYTNSKNHAFNYKDFLAKIPLDKVVQIHFTGGFQDQKSGYWIDSHSEDTPEEVWQIMEYLFEYCKPKGVILERDEHIPPLNHLKKELEKARNLWKKAKNIA